MQHRYVRRLFAGTVVAGAMLAVGAGPALAAPAEVTVDMYLGDSIVAAGHAGVVAGPVVYASAPTTVDNAVVTFDSSGLAGVATLTAGDNDDCAAASPTRLVCSHSYPLEFGEDGLGGAFNVSVKAVKGAKPGASGEVRATFTGDGVKRVTERATVRVAEAIDLAAGRSATARAKPGAGFDVPMTVRNTGGRAVDGVTVMFYNDYAFAPRTRFRNCTYVDDMLRSCTFDQRLRPGASYRVTVPYRLRKDTYAPGGAFGESQWLTPAERADLVSYLDRHGYTIGSPGSGAALKLTETSPSTALRVPQTDVNPDNNWSHVEVTATGKQGADLSAVGDRVTGSAGATVTATVGMHNRGPATIDWGRSGETIARVDVVVPRGSTVVGVPKGCRQVVGGDVDWEGPVEPGARAYRCESGVLLRAGKGETFDFGLRIDTVIPDATGAVIVNAPCECPQFSKDLDPGNNKATLVVNGTDTGDDNGDDNTDDGGQGGGLPVTGPAGAAIAGGGGLLLTGGVLGLVLARRRRTRFIA